MCTALYADDFTIFASAKEERASEKLLQNTINILEKRTKERGMKFSQEKTVLMQFSKRKVLNLFPLILFYNRVAGTTFQESLDHRIDMQTGYL